MSNEWISAAEVCERVCAISDPASAMEAICARANDGLLLARARRLIISGIVEDHAFVPEKFWWARGEAALKQNWTTGDFETWIDKRIECRAYGVEFRMSDVEAMLPRRKKAEWGGSWVTGNYASAAKCLAELEAALGLSRTQIEKLVVDRGRAGLLTSRCAQLWSRVTDLYSSREEVLNNTAIADWVWQHCLSVPDAILDWSNNVFAGEGTVDGDTIKVRLTGVEFEIGAVISLENYAKTLASSQPVARAEPDSAVAGRKLSELWPDWVAEAALAIHLDGIPPGEGSQGQGELIKRIGDALAARGLDAPSRTTVQPVVQAILDRIRAAGN